MLLQCDKEKEPEMQEVQSLDSEEWTSFGNYLFIFLPGQFSNMDPLCFLTVTS